MAVSCTKTAATGEPETVAPVTVHTSATPTRSTGTRPYPYRKPLGEHHMNRTTDPLPAKRITDLHTLGQIRAAAYALGDDSLFGRVVQGCEHAVETVGRFLVGDVEHAAQGTESAQRHSALAV